MIIYAAADTKYFMEHGIEFINSCVSNENYCHITIFRNFEESVEVQEKALFDFMEKNNPKLHPNAKEYLIKPEYFQDMYNVDIQDTRAYYASFRFLHLPTVMENFPHQDFLVVDIDSIIRQKLPDLIADLGLYLRLNNTIGANLYEQMGMKVAAGIVFIPWHQKEIARRIKREILDWPARWFNDQQAILKVYEWFTTSKNQPMIFDFAGTKWLDWDFIEDSYIWTGKGDRKTSESYLKGKQQYS